MEKRKVKGVLEWPTPKCVKDVQKFLGLANYYHRFIEGFASIARPLYDIVKIIDSGLYFSFSFLFYFTSLFFFF